VFSGNLSFTLIHFITSSSCSMLLRQVHTTFCDPVPCRTSVRPNISASGNHILNRPDTRSNQKAQRGWSWNHKTGILLTQSCPLHCPPYNPLPLCAVGNLSLEPSFCRSFLLFSRRQPLAILLAQRMTIRAISAILTLGHPCPPSWRSFGPAPAYPLPCPDSPHPLPS